MKVVTAVVNNPDFIEIQYHTLKKYFKGEYEFIVFNDAKDFPDVTNGGDVHIKHKIKEICDTLHITCINIPNQHHKEMNMSSRHADTFNNHVLPYQINNLDKYIMIDSDMFLIDYFDITRYFKYNCAIILQSRDNFRKNYFWPGLCYLDFTKITNLNLLNWNCSEGCDSGGMMQEWLKLQMKENPFPNTDNIRWTNTSFHTDTIYFMKHLWSCSWNKTELPENIKNKDLIDFFENDFRNSNNKYFCEIYENVFLHYRAGSNWLGEGMDAHKKLTQSLKQILLS